MVGKDFKVGAKSLYVIELLIANSEIYTSLYHSRLNYYLEINEVTLANLGNIFSSTNTFIIILKYIEKNSKVNSEN